MFHALHKTPTVTISHICGMFTYLTINLISVALPLAFSFHPKIKFYREWKYLFPAIAIMGAFFLTWDHYFTKWGVWSFNPDYVMGIYIAGMPIEEWMFFLFIPYSCLFIYHCLNLFFKHRWWDKAAPFISWAVVITCAGLMAAGLNRFYTFATAFFLAVFILMMMIYRHSYWMGRFYRAYLVSKIPFLIVNGALTALPVVVYNDNENLGVRINTIPAEDAFYSMLMLMMVTAVYERLKKRSSERGKV